MRMITGAIATALLLGTASLAYAANVTSTVASVNLTKDTLTLKNGMTYTAPKDVSLTNLKPGEKVMVDYAKSGKTMTIASVKPLA